MPKFVVDPADVKPSLMNWALVGIMAITFIVLAKWALTRFPIPGLSEVIASA